ncbi:Holliday junction branch migration protein RuvA [Leucobacter luti]|uniref:Holliday junction branch migration protein RuvA n=1 Tax=Leucobacter luti TaxID=340320 RepID=UPI00215DBEB4|nr:Holliday junction branch migration protein RuvA [Leucobacter luti]
MIASIRGPVLASGAGWAVIGLGGLGMRVEVPSGRVPQPQPGEDLALLTSLVVREDSLTLFGFHSEAELEVFGHLIAVSGVGPRSALGVLSALAPAEIAEAVASEDEKPFRKVSGIGPKTAKLIVVSLAGKLASLDLGEPSVAGRGPAAASVADAVADGLVGLGWGQLTLSSLLPMLWTRVPRSPTLSCCGLRSRCCRPVGPVHARPVVADER